MPILLQLKTSITALQLAAIKRESNLEAAFTVKQQVITAE